MIKKDRLIPVDSVIVEFAKHLKCHPRTVLSARFGNGKSFFLSEFERKLKRRYVLLKIYPVNYQVAENQDIFELIKRDILFQLYAQGMVPDNYQIPDSVASFFFIYKEWESFAEEMLTGLSCFDSSNTLKATLGAAKFLKSIKLKYEDFKENAGGIGELLDNFIDKFDKKGIYEADPITTIITDIIKDWRCANRRKKICLVFEDMDRIDPAHIFRILNVISAHIDYGYKYGISPVRASIVGNKFGVDNIVVCLDYNNLRNIFHHFYGSDASYEGYINKFCDKGIFNYSLQSQLQKYYIDSLVRVTGMGGDAISALTEQYDFTSHTLREFFHTIDDIESQITLPLEKNNFIPHKGPYIMSAILRRLGKRDIEIVEILSRAFLSKPVIFAVYLASSMMIQKKIKSDIWEFSFGDKYDEYIKWYAVSNIHSDGSASVREKLYASWKPTEIYENPEDIFWFIQHFVNN